MPFFKTETNTVKISPQDVADAKALLQAVQKKFHTNIKTNQCHWQDQFAKLRKEYGTKRTSNALKFFLTHIGGQFIPDARSAAGFRKKFLAIEAAAQRHAIQSPVKKTIITDHARYAQQLAGDLVWPGDEKKDELEFIQRSIDNYLEWLEFLRVKGEQHAILRYPNEFRDLYNLSLADVGMFVGRYWLPKIHSAACHWKGWNGKLLAWVWHPEHPGGKRDLMQKLVGFGHDAFVMDRIFESWRKFKNNQQ